MGTSLVTLLIPTNKNKLGGGDHLRRSRWILDASLNLVELMEAKAIWPEDRVVPPIEQSIDLSSSYKSVEDRYYSRYYYAQDDGEDQVVLVHTNRICLVSLAPNHPVVKEQKEIKNLNFHVSANCNRLKNKVSGKGKKGGQGLDEKSVLCFIECASGERFAVRSCVKGKLVAINQKIVQNPQIILDKSPSQAHLAIILTKIPDGITDLKARLLTETEYYQKCHHRQDSSIQ